MNNTKKFNWGKAFFPFCMAICAFICFVLVYLYCIFYLVVPLYFSPLVCLIPFLVFLAITLYTGKKQNPKAFISIIAYPLAPLLALLSIIYILVFLPSSFPIDNSKYYSRAMNYNGNEQRRVFEIFPKEIPSDAKDVVFFYDEYGFTDYSREARLEFKTNSSTINWYVLKYQSKMVSIDSYFFAKESVFADKNKVDYDVYLIYESGFEVSVILINNSESIMIFYGHEVK